MSIPEHPITLMRKVYRDVLPTVHHYLKYWKKRAENIPNEELKKQALNSIQTKTFHCEGGSILSIIARNHLETCIEFIVAYQTISDYLDNLCDRSTSLDPKDFRMLHQSMDDALTINADVKNYYQFRKDQDDGGYLQDLVLTCQRILRKLKHYPLIVDHLRELCRYYCDLQVHKHVKVDERIPRLEKWFESYRPHLPEMEWYEFSACAGSTLGIFCLVSYAFQEHFTEELAKQIKYGYFPYVQGLHILLDYFIDQQEDEQEGDLNFCHYYESETMLLNRLEHFVIEADKSLQGIPHEKFHRLINRGLLGIYLSDDKVYEQKQLWKAVRKLIRLGGSTSIFFYLNGRAYRTFQKWNLLKSS
ncbi:tetraprenyl-beta-curcumene synthase family protein [Aeribacillus alveayuensis]|uniref:Tetraprenyl-beta-curcumene synthase n=1 Tax=Aeribacillus alveayuensis TaxID=279215 RepID=A0ABT9VJ24_9BACI|nr:tetraprenyl-beta-curcumene synthase [Bacillus alveayuensis]